MLSGRFDVNYAEGCKIIGEDISGFDAAVAAAKESDVVVMAMGGNCGWVNVTGGEGKDRSHPATLPVLVTVQRIFMLPSVGSSLSASMPSTLKVV